MLIQPKKYPDVYRWRSSTLPSACQGTGKQMEASFIIYQLTIIRTKFLFTASIENSIAVLSDKLIGTIVIPKILG
jgi:hypothetical protein